MRKIVLILLMLQINILTVLSQVSLTREDKVIVANTFLENNVLRQERDTCNSIVQDYKQKVALKDSVIVLKSSVILQKDGVIEEKTNLITNINEELKQTKKQTLLTKVNSYLLIGGMTLSFAGILYVLIKK